MRRSPLTRKTPLRSTSTLRRTPLKKKRARAIPPTIYTEVVTRDMGCRGRVLIPGIRCLGRLDPHHIVRRSQGGPDTAANLVTLCRAHHDWVHANPAASRALGLLASPTDRKDPDQ